MTYKGKSDLELAIQIMEEIGRKVIKTAEERKITREEAAVIIKEEEKISSCG